MMEKKSNDKGELIDRTVQFTRLAKLVEKIYDWVVGFIFELILKQW